MMSGIGLVTSALIWLSSASGALVHSDALDVLAAARPADWLPLSAASLAGTDMAKRTVAGLNSAQADDRARYAFVLAELGRRDHAIKEALARLLNDSSRQVRLHAGVALCRLGDDRGLHAAMAALCSAPVWLRYYAAVGLWAVRTATARSVLETAEIETEPFVEDTIRQALRDWDAPRPWPVVRHTGTAGEEAEDPVEWAIGALIAETDWWWHRGAYDQCIRCNEAIVFLDPSEQEQYTNSAWLLWSTGRHTRAIGTYHRCLVAVPQSSHGPFYLGFYYLQHDDLFAAEKFLRTAVKREPTDHLARRALAHCLEKQGRLSEALAEWDILAEQRPNDGSVLVNIQRVKAAIEQQAEDR
ncbi:MAG: tetratricopeptide repeat protein [Armatimonadetes bacterium]|nr:tetratricopeptide repeat protein [Armatimonadota bacterium]